MSTPQRIWLNGLRRAWIASRALARWAAERDMTGVVWTPAAYDTDDIAPAVASLVESGATADASLLWDTAVVDIRGAADVLASVYRSTDGRSGYVAVWLDPARLRDPGKAARELIGDVRRANVAAALAWTPQRAQIVEAMVAAGAPVALSGVREASARDAVASARSRGMDRCRAEAAKNDRPPESVPEIPVFLLDTDGEDGEDAVFTVTMTTDLALYSAHARGAGGLPLSPEAEEAGMRAAVEALSSRAGKPARDDTYTPESFDRVVVAELTEFGDDDVLEDIWSRDHTAWKEDPTEIADRLGWLDSPELMQHELADIKEFARKMRAGGQVAHVLVCGMGGSSLAPETFSALVGGGLPLTVCDTTDPDHIAKLTSSLDPSRTLVVVSSKSGTTVETRAHLEHFWKWSGRADRFVAVTDPGSPLEELAGERGFVRTFRNPADIGGRFSAISYFGLVPAALCGVDADAVVRDARRGMSGNGPGVAASDAPALRLAAAVGEAKLTEVRDKLTVILPRTTTAFGPWLEQLVAESTGKEGTGVLPVVGEELAAPISYSDDRLFCVYTLPGEPVPPALEALEADHPIVRITWGGVGAEMYRWEMATAVVGYLLDINPFDQPDVEASKRRTQERLAAGDSLPDAGSAPDLLQKIAPPRYIAVQAFLEPSADNARRLESVRMKLRDRYRVAVTAGFGPRFLHSTGQFHKGGTNTGVFLQVTGPHTNDVDIPGMDLTFGRLIDAQADGDLDALRAAGRAAARLSLEELEAL